MIIENSTLSKLVHVVSDVKERAKAFSRLLGVPVPEVFATEPSQEGDREAFTWFRGRYVGGEVRIANLVLGPMIVELIEPVDEDTPWAEYMRSNGEGVFSMVFTVNDFDAHIDRLEANGMAMFHRGEYGSGRYAYFETDKELGTTLCIQQLGPVPS